MEEKIMRDVPTQKLDVTTKKNGTTVLLPGCIPGATPFHHSIMAGTELTLEPGNFYHILICFLGEVEFVTDGN